MKPFVLLAFAAALSGAVSLGAVGADAQSAKPQDTPRTDHDLPARLEAAKELAALISEDTAAQAVTQMSARTWPPIEKELRAKNPSIDAAAIAGLRTEFERIQLQFLFDLMKDTPIIYARYFTEQELRDLLAFYRTPIGAKTLQVMPQISGEVMGLVIPRLPDIISQTNDAFTKILNQRGYRL